MLTMLLYCIYKACSTVYYLLYLVHWLTRPVFFINMLHEYMLINTYSIFSLQMRSLEENQHKDRTTDNSASRDRHVFVTCAKIRKTSERYLNQWKWNIKGKKIFTYKYWNFSSIFSMYMYLRLSELCLPIILLLPCYSTNCCPWLI